MAGIVDRAAGRYGNAWASAVTVPDRGSACGAKVDVATLSSVCNPDPSYWLAFEQLQA